MNENNKMENLTQLINNLSSENEKLKTENKALQITLELSKNSDTKVKALMDKLERYAEQYKEAIDAANNAKKEYELAHQEAKILRKQYELKFKDFMKQLQ